MNIIIVNHYATTPDYNGGTRHYDFAKELVNKGHNVTIIASSFNHFIKKETKSYKKKGFLKQNIDGVNFIWIKTIPYKNNIKRILNMISFYKNGRKILSKSNLFPRPDIVIGSTVHLLAAQLALSIAKKTNAEFIFEERDLWPQTFIDFGKITKRNIISKVLYRYENYFYKKSTKVIVLFPKATSYVVSRGVDEDNVIYLPNGYSKQIKQDNVDSTELNQILINNETVTYIGSHGIANELDEIINLASECKDLNLKFVFIGDGNEKNRLIKKSKDKNLSNIHFIDSINKNQVQDALSKSTFTIISIKDSPLYKYGFSMNKLYDYFLAGRPIQMIVPYHLASEYDTIGVTISSNLLEHKEAFEKYLSDEEYYIKASQNVHEFGKKYDWSTLANKFLKEI